MKILRIPLLLFVLCVSLLGGTAVLAADQILWPYPVQPAGKAPVSYALVSGTGALGTAALGWSKNALLLDVNVTDATPATAKTMGIAPAEMFHADSIEVWFNRHQFGISETSDGLAVWDYLYGVMVSGVRGTWRRLPTGYQVHVEIPWTAIELSPQTDLAFQFALQVNDLQRTGTDTQANAPVVRAMFPDRAVWDRPSTYGTVMLNQRHATRQCAESPVPFARLEVRCRGYEKVTEAYITRQELYAKGQLLLRVLDASGAIFREITLPASTGELHVSLPWDEQHAGIYTAALYLVVKGKPYGPISETYFNAGPTDIAHYRSSRKAPEDLAAFWAGKIAAMRTRPFNATREEVISPWPNATVEKVRLVNHRGNPMIVYITRNKNEAGPLPVHLNVYPPMATDKPERPIPGMISMTFCGSLQGEARLPGQTKNELLWARAESLDACYWLDVVLDGVRALDYVAAQPDANGKGMVTGGSRGGWYAFALAAVAPDRVTYARFTSPCYSDVTMNMQLGYSSAASEIYINFTRDRKMSGGRVFRTFQYFDPLFLATLIKTRIAYSAGLQDNICSAIGMTAAANNLTYQDTYFVLDNEAGHGGSPYIPKFDEPLRAILK